MIKRNKDVSLGVILGVAKPQPDDWGTKPEHINKAGYIRAWGASDAHIDYHNVLFAEGDPANMDPDEQVRLLHKAGLPAPSFTVYSGNKSVHPYWKINKCPADKWKNIQKRIIQLLEEKGIGRPSTYVTTVSKLIDRKYVERDGSSLIPTTQGRTLWIDVAPFYNETDVFDQGLFTYGFTSSMEEQLDLIEAGVTSAPEHWSQFVETFREMHNIALERRREKPTIRQIQFLQGILNRMSDQEREGLVGKVSVEELSGERVRNLIDQLSQSEQTNIPPSEKKIATIQKMVDRLKIDLTQFLNEMGENDINDLTGGRGGSASNAIGALIELDKNSPATEKQVATIISMTDSLEMPIEDAMAAVKTESIEMISKSDASILIGNLKKTINSRRKGKKK